MRISLYLEGVSIKTKWKPFGFITLIQCYKISNLETFKIKEVLVIFSFAYLIKNYYLGREKIRFMWPTIMSCLRGRHLMENLRTRVHSGRHLTTILWTRDNGESCIVEDQEDQESLWSQTQITMLGMHILVSLTVLFSVHSFNEHYLFISFIPEYIGSWGNRFQETHGPWYIILR